MTSDSVRRMPVVPREYYGFRTQVGGVLTPFIARVELRDEGGTSWGHWFSKGNANGSFHAVPPVAALKRIDDAAGHNAINLIAAGMDLPAELVAELPELKGGGWVVA